MISTSVLNFLMEISVLSFIIPVVILMAWRLRTHKSLIPALAGVLVFLVFAKLLEAIPYAFFVGFDNPLSRLVRTNDLTYAIYQGIAAAIFEEMGRYIAFSQFLTKYQDDRHFAVTYGIGHGGIECMIVLGWTDLQYYVGATLLNGEGKSASLPKSMIHQLKSLSSTDVILDGFAGLVGMVLQIALTILVFQAVRNAALRVRLLIMAMVLHGLSYIPNGLYQAGMIPHLGAFVLQLLVLGFTLFMAGHIYRQMRLNEKTIEREKKKEEAMAQQKNWAYANKKLTDIHEERRED